VEVFVSNSDIPRGNHVDLARLTTVGVRGILVLVMNVNRILRAAISVGERPYTTRSAAFATATSEVIGTEPPCQKASISR
jgi:hypothetical protein